jgi:hypothetical protein
LRENRSSFVLVAVVVALGVGLLLSIRLPAAEKEHAYVGSKDCKKCHIKEWRSWSETKMAKSFELLRPGVAVDEKTAAGLDPDADYTGDQTCLRCHTTGFGKPGGFVSVEKTPELVGGGCEVCHGPGGTYLEDRYMSMDNKEYKKSELVAVGLVGEITRELCVECHNTDNPTAAADYVFDFEKSVAEGIHEILPLKYDHDG